MWPIPDVWAGAGESVGKWGCFSAVPTASFFLGTVPTSPVFWFPRLCCFSLLYSSFELVHVFLKNPFPVVSVRCGGGRHTQCMCTLHCPSMEILLCLLFKEVTMRVALYYMLRALQGYSQFIFHANHKADRIRIGPLK